MPKKFRSDFFQNSNDLLAVVNFQGEFVDLNPRWVDVLGRSPEELMAKPYIEYMHPDDREPTLRAAANLEVGAESLFNFENRFYAKDGRIIWFQWNVRRIDSDQVLLCSGREITETKSRELLLKMQNDRLELTQQIAHFGTWEFDLATGKVYWSKEVYQIHGLEPRDEPPGFEELLKLFAPESRERLVQEVNSTIQNGTSYGFRCELLVPNAGIRHAYAIGVPLKDVNGKTIKLHGTLADLSVTAEKELELLAKNKELL